jgi:hypothetical protein
MRWQRRPPVKIVIVGVVRLSTSSMARRIASRPTRRADEVGLALAAANEFA